MNYRWDSKLNLFHSERAERFEYSDGVEVEQRLLDVVTQADDRGTFSSELAKHIHDWPSEYHLSRRRHCLLRPLNIGRQHRVLELGCGCGAITRYLGELEAGVVAVEGSLMRARIAAQRTRDLPGVRVVADDLLHFDTTEQFDYVLLIGVLEYAAKFSSAKNPFETYLQVVQRFLAPGGKVVIAIENQLGLKYWNGSTEDHVGSRFFGLQDLYDSHTARTFGRHELQQLLHSAGLEHLRFYYPFPDYKLPSVILAEEALDDLEFNAGDVIAHTYARDYNGSPYRAFDDALVGDVVQRNRLLADLSNSFLVVASPARIEPGVVSELAFSWSVDRIPELCTQTTFTREHGKIVVHKRSLAATTVDTLQLPGNIMIRYAPRTTKYSRGKQLLTELKRVRARGSDLTAIVETLRPWMEHLMQNARVAEREGAHDERVQQLSAYVISGEFLDCTLGNLLDSGHGLVRIDEEWTADGDIPLPWVVTRGLVWSLMTGLPANDEVKSAREIIHTLCRAHNLSVTEAEISACVSLEAAFQSAVTGRSWSVENLRHTSGGMQPFNRAIQELDRLQTLLQSRDRELEELRSVVAAQKKDLAAVTAKLASTHNELLRTQPKEQPPTAGLPAGGRVGARLSWKSRRQVRQDARLIKRSHLFDAAWYLSRNPDVANGRIDPAMHYLIYGGFEDRDPSTKFHSRWYLEQNEDVRRCGMNPLVHYLRFGAQEGRQPKP